MTERLRAIASRLRRLVGERRRHLRYKVRLAASVVLLGAKGEAATKPLEGHTRDVSACGLALVLPAVRVGDRYLAGEAQTLGVTLRLPAATVRLRGTPSRYERLDDEGAGTAYLIGLRITEMDERDRAAFDEYLKRQR
jgi:PilZ domain